MNTAQIILLILVIIVITIRTYYFIRKRLLIKNYEELYDRLLLYYSYEGNLYLCNLSIDMRKYFRKHLKEKLSQIDIKYTEIEIYRPFIFKSSIDMVKDNNAIWRSDDFDNRAKFIKLILKELRL